MSRRMCTHEKSSKRYVQKHAYTKLRQMKTVNKFWYYMSVVVSGELFYCWMLKMCPHNEFGNFVEMNSIHCLCIRLLVRKTGNHGPWHMTHAQYGNDISDWCIRNIHFANIDISTRIEHHMYTVHSVQSTEYTVYCILCIPFHWCADVLLSKSKFP